MPPDYFWDFYDSIIQKRPVEDIRKQSATDRARYRCVFEQIRWSKYELARRAKATFVMDYASL